MSKPKRKNLKLVKLVKAKYGKDCYKNWGKKGGNPILLKHKK